MPRKQDIAPFSSALLLAEICATNRFTPSPAYASQVLSALTEQGRRGDSSIFPSVGLNHILGQEFVPRVGVSFFASPREVMHLSQHREEQFFLNMFLNLWPSALNFMEMEVLGMMYHWKCTCFPSLSLWASSWFYHCLSQHFSALSTCS